MCVSTGPTRATCGTSVSIRGAWHLSDSLDEVARDAEIVVLAAPSVYLKTTLEPLTEPLGDKFIVSAIKGIVPDDLITVAEYVNRRYDVPFDQIGIVSGPCHAEEVALERLSYLTVVCKTLENSRILGDKIRTDYINVGHSTDHIRHRICFRAEKYLCDCGRDRGRPRLRG